MTSVLLEIPVPSLIEDITRIFQRLLHSVEDTYEDGDEDNSTRWLLLMAITKLYNKEMAIINFCLIIWARNDQIFTSL